MGKRSLQIQKQYIQHVKNALVDLGLTQRDFAELKLELSRSTIGNFLNGKPVSKENFVRICKSLNLNWQEIADLTEENDRKIVNAQVNRLSGKVDNSDSDHHTLVTQLREQVKADIETRCGTMRILDMSKPLGLDNIYTKVNILEKISGRRRKDINELTNVSNFEAYSRFNSGKVKEKISGRQAVSKYRTLIILGKPGAGKTTFLKHLVIQCNRGLFQSELVPFFITLKEFAETEKQLKLFEYLNRYTNSPNKKNLDHIMQQGKALICLDGLDEVLAQDSKRVIDEIRNLVTKYPNNQYLMTCRIAAKEYTFEKFTEVEMADFDWQQITTFARNWFQNKPVKPKTFLTRLENDQPIQELASSPLLLTLLCLAFEESGDFPGNRAELYKEGLGALLKKWDAKRGIQRDKVYQKLSIQRKEDLLSKIAWDTFEPGDYFFKQDKVERYISEYIRNLPGANTDELDLQLDSEAVLKSLESRHGLLVERAKHIYSFSHRTFQEYFAAREMISVRQSSDETLQELVSHLFDKRWREVFLLAVAMSPNAEKLILLIKEKIDYLFKDSDVLESFLFSLYKKSCSLDLDLEKGYLLPSIVRSFYFATELIFSSNLARLIDQKTTDSLIDSKERALDNVSSIFLKFTDKLNNEINSYYDNFDRVISTYDFQILIKDVQESFRKLLFYTRDIDCELHDKLIELVKETPYQKKIREIIRKSVNSSEEYVWEYIWDPKPLWWKENGEVWAKKIREVVIQYRYIGNTWRFNEREKELLNDYYYANQLLIQCLHQDCYIRSEVRREIEETILLPIAEIEKRKNNV